MKSIASHNGLAAVRRAYELLTKNESPLNAVVEGTTLIEDDPNDHSVGYGGLPNTDGIVELDAAVMDGPSRRGAGVASVRNIRHVSKLARLLMQQTKRVLVVGEGALSFARVNGFPEENLLTDKARRMWLYWLRSRSEKSDWLPPAAGEESLDVETWYEKEFYPGGTVHVSARDALGDLACCTSTSGHAFKIPGRVGDSPILGAGLYCDNDVGTCGSIGHGEANLRNLSSHLAVEFMRQGKSPVEAGLEVLRRVAKNTPQYERDEQDRPSFNLQLFLMAKDGTHAGVAMWGPKKIAVADEQGARLEDCTPLFSKSAASSMVRENGR